VGPGIGPAVMEFVPGQMPASGAGEKPEKLFWELTARPPRCQQPMNFIPIPHPNDFPFRSGEVQVFFFDEGSFPDPQKLEAKVKEPLTGVPAIHFAAEEPP